MLSGVTTGRFHEPSRGEPKKVAKLRLETKVAGLNFSTFPVFGGKWSDRPLYFQRSGPHLTQGPPNKGYTWAQISLTA